MSDVTLTRARRSAFVKGVAWLLAINVVVNLVADITLNDHGDEWSWLEIVRGASRR